MKSRRPLAPRPAPLAPAARRKEWAALPGPLAFGHVEWDRLDAEAARDSAAIVEARRLRVGRPPSKHGY
jgi:hypothetical protein